MSIGDNIKKARGRIRQSDLAELLNVDVSTVSRWENNKNIPNGEILARIAQVLNTSTEFLLSNDSSKTSNSEKTKQEDDTDTETILTGGIANNMFIINDKKSDRVYYLPNNEEGRSIFLSALASGLNGTNIPVLSNTITRDNNSGNKLGVINN